MNNDDLKRCAERVHFERFCESARLPLVQGSINQPPPPAPDLVAQFDDIGRVSFELVRLDDEVRLTGLRLMHQAPGFLQHAFDTLPTTQRASLAYRYTDAQITIQFQGADDSLAARRRALPFVWGVLECLPDRFRGKVDLWGLKPPPAIGMIYVSRIKTKGQPCFRSLNSGFTLPLEAHRIARKLRTQYACDTPLELLAYIEYGEIAHANGAEQIAGIVLPLLPMSQFRRVWVYEGLPRRVGLTLP